MLDFVANPLFPLFALVALGFLWLGFFWGSRTAENRISDDIHCLGRFHIDGHCFEARCAGYAAPENDPCEDDDDDGDPHTVEDLLRGDRK